MTDRKAQYRASKAKEREAKRASGLMRVEVWVPKDRAHDIKTLAQEMVDECRRKAAP